MDRSGRTWKKNHVYCQLCECKGRFCNNIHRSVGQNVLFVKKSTFYLRQCQFDAQCGKFSVFKATHMALMVNEVSRFRIWVMVARM